MKKTLFNAYYDPLRFPFLDQKKDETNLFSHVGHEALRKTACLVSDQFNVFIDSSDGINEDLPIKEYCGRIKSIVKSFDKPFLYFKCNYSKERSSDIASIAIENGGKVLPFFIWNLKSQNPKFYTDILPIRKDLISKNKKRSKKSDILYAANEKVYIYPKPNALDSQVSWSDYERFNIGSPENTGFFEMHTRENIKSKLQSLKRIKLKNVSKLDYMSYIDEIYMNKAQFSPPGISEYTCRMFDSSALGQCAILRKNSYDFYDSWKEYLPEINIESNTLEEELLKILEDYEEWGEKALFYFENHLSTERIWKVFTKEIHKFRGEL